MAGNKDNCYALINKLYAMVYCLHVLDCQRLTIALKSLSFPPMAIILLLTNIRKPI